MIDRRKLLLSSAAAAAGAAIYPSFAVAAGAAKPTTPASKLSALFDSFVKDGLDHSPEGVTSLGLDTGDRAYQKSELGDRSLAEIARQKAVTTEQLKALQAIGRTSLTPADTISYDVVFYGLKTQNEANRRFNYGSGGAGAPYVVSQLTGAYQEVPDFLDSQHSIATKADADAYLDRLDAFATVLDQESDVARHDFGLGVTPPDFVLARTLEQMNKLRGMAPEKSVLVESVVRRAREKKIAGDYAGPATMILESKIYPALDRQIALLKSLQPKAVHDAGVWRLPDGDAYYADSLINWTTSSKKPEEVHQIGLDIVKSHTAMIDTIMKAHGMTKGTVGQRLHGMYQDPKFRYPNTDAGKDKLIADLNEKVKAVQAKLPQWFGTLPKAKLIIKRVPKYTEAGAPGGYYNQGALDGSRPGTYYINLRDTAEVPSWTLPTLTYHEGIPGHHLQLSLQQEADLPMIRKLTFFSSYIEGWALYAEQLAVEMGMYDSDPFGHIGQLHDAMFRGVRLVVDTGMHAMKWSREQAIKYYAETLGDPAASATTEVERYCVWPGQACAYMLGKITWLGARQRARTALGSRFDIHKFHDAGLLGGAVPLAVLDQTIDRYVAAQKA